ncbi:Osmoprotectant import ATP-binding protein OsmV [Paraburkholderia domus]|uniref:ABC transporter ATP-binding protein n=1 Tax=Paraburkholderia domus TaxID=2793075 RepID=UPI0019138B46|nr:ABC transporter ATP-binding protein [Paraburkholderia domus]MBK5091555.1 ABC transporter ATP-binding protein [Burkholderia sp. R-69927]CAE6937374.1 Osmoprotectant import ATP-binding protein OsmV [Paraburkholderia domus]
MIRLEGLSKIFNTVNGQVAAVENVSFELAAGEICVLLGPSGCGKTTTMKMINRLIQPTSGKVYINGRDTDEVDPIELRRTIGYVIQQIGLFPNKTVADNICVVPDLLGWDRRKSRARAAELLEMVALDPGTFMKRYPRELSGGQQQRVGVVRALAADPPVMLMDEPFGAIDPVNRGVIQDEFLRMQKQLRKTVIFVSHDLDEALKMADKVAIFRAGRLEQIARPSQLLANPATPFVETFLGSDRILKRLRLVRVAEAMISNVDVVFPGDPVAKAGQLLKASKHPAVMMLGPDGRVSGIVSQEQTAAGNGTCGDYATPSRVSIPVLADLRNAVALMFANGMSIIPCVDDDGKLRGALTYLSIVQSLEMAEVST